MATSGAVSTSTLTVQQIFDRSFRLCGITPQMLNAEMIDVAFQALDELLKSWSNKGINLWRIEKVVQGLYQGAQFVTLPAGTIDVLDANHRSLTLPSGGTPATSAGGTVANAFDSDITTLLTQTATGGNVSYNFGSAVYVTSFGYLPGATGTLDLILEISDDGSTWRTILDLDSATYTDREWVWKDIDEPQSAQYFRVRETSTGTIVARQIVFGRNQSEVPLSRINRDTYTALPSKGGQGQPNQYWLDRQRDQARMWINPTSSSALNQLVVWRHAQIQDLGRDMTLDIDVPDRWRMALRYALAVAMMPELPGEWSQDRLVRHQNNKIEAVSLFEEAADEERDDSPTYLIPQIGVYNA